MAEAAVRNCGIAELLSLSQPMLKIDTQAFKGAALVVSREFDDIFREAFLLGNGDQSCAVAHGGGEDLKCMFSLGVGMGIDL